MRRRRKRRGLWLPVLGGISGVEGDGGSVGVDFTHTIPSESSLSTRPQTFPITFDQPLEEQQNVTNATKLTDFVGQGYVLERAVGNCYVVLNQQDNTTGGNVGPGGCKVTCGMFVARADPANPEVPIGDDALTDNEDIEAYSPDDPDNVREPWLWRRTWLLGLNGAFNGEFFSLVGATNSLPPNNLFYPSGMTGPFIDSRVKRRITGDNRLWFTVVARNWPLGSQAGAGAVDDLIINGHLDLRLYGHLVRNTKQATF